MMDFDDLTEHAYVPYSKKSSTALVRSESGLWFPGIRVENISYPLSISAAQNALFCCLSEGDQPEVLFTDDPDTSMISFWQKEFNITVELLTKSNLPDYNFANVKLEGDLNIPKKLTALLDVALVDESNFPVAALLETEDGFFSGVNVECSSWNMGLCAERVAIGKALAYGSKKLKGLHIHTREGEFSSPCGACRQVIMEHLPNRQIHLHHADHSESVHFSNDLLPHSFSSSSLSNK